MEDLFSLQGVTFPLSGFVIRVIGRRLAIYGGCLVFTAGAAPPYFTPGRESTMLITSSSP